MQSSKTQRIPALMESEIKAPVMALESIKPRRIMIWPMEKQSAACKEKYSAIKKFHLERTVEGRKWQGSYPPTRTKASPLREDFAIELNARQN